MRIWFKLGSLLFKSKLDAEMTAEMQAHVELQTERNRRAGMNPDEARYAALRQFGNVASIQEQAREGRGWVWLEQAAQDLRHAGKALLKNPGFTTVVVLSLALGIGANTALFTAFDSLLLRPLAVHASGQLVVVDAMALDGAGKQFPYPRFGNRTFPWAFYDQFKTQVGSMSGLAAAGGWPAEREMLVTGGGSAASERIRTEEVTGSYFPMLGVATAAGRTLNEEDDRPGKAQPVAVISYKCWRNWFAADPAIIGRTLQIDGVSLTVVGVLAQGFDGAAIGIQTELWLPIQLSPQIDWNQPWAGWLKSPTMPFLHILGRMRPGISREQAAAELDALYQRKLAELDPRRARADTDTRDLLQARIALSPAGNGYGGYRTAYERSVLVLMAMVGLLLVVTCVNVAGLQLARGAVREREFALRAAVGASRRRLMAQLMTENLLLAALGGLAGLFVAWAGIRWLNLYLTALDMRADGRVLAFALIATLLTGLTVGLLPALRLSRTNLIGAIKASASGSLRLHRSLVMAQFGLAFLLCVAAALLIRTFQNLAGSDAGFQRSQLLLASVSPPRGATPSQRFRLYQQTRAALAQLPGVRSATILQGMSMLTGVAIVQNFTVDDQGAGNDEPLSAGLVFCGPDFLKTMGITLVTGRDFSPEDEVDGGSIRPVVINEGAANKLFGSINRALGRRLRLMDKLEYEIVGVAREIKPGWLRDTPKFVFCLSLRDRPGNLPTLLALRTTEGAAISLGDLSAVLRRIDPTATLPQLRTMDTVLSRQVVQERMLAHLAGFFGGFVLLLAALGLFGVQSFTVARRTREIGVRLALGAHPGDLLFMVLRQGVRFVLWGALAGLTASIGLTRLISSLLYGISATDLTTYLVVSLLLFVVAAIACWLPARRAAKVDPMVALRAE